MAKPKNFEKVSQGELGSMLHSLLFAYEKVLYNFYGTKEAKQLFNYIIEELIPILYDEKNKVIDKDLSIEENMERLEYYLNNDEMVKDLTIRRQNYETFIIDIKECSFAKEGIHALLDMKGGSCPYALIAAAVLSSVEGEDQYVNVGESEFTDLGSKTFLKIE